MSHHVQKKALITRLRALGVRLEGIEEALEAPHTRDWEDLATEREDDEVLEGLGKSGQAEIARIRAALDRMADGTYGTCTKCGQDIAEKRLVAVPEAALCRECATSA